jgi:replicative DNA helicase
MEKIEFLILRNLLHNSDYLKKVLPFIKSDYFEDKTQKIVFEEIQKFVEKYNKQPSKEILSIEVEHREDIDEQSFKEVVHLISSLENVPVEESWLIDTTEKWCRDRAIYLALMESIHIADGKNDKKTRDSIPSILSDALAVSFDNHIGHDYLQDYIERFDFYRRTEEKISFDIEYLNKITKGGISKKTLTIFMAGCVHPETKIKVRIRKK